MKENHRLIAVLSERLPGPPVQFATSILQPILEAGCDQIDWMEKRLGTSLTETCNQDAHAIESEEELLHFSSNALYWLTEQLNIKNIPKLASRESVAFWMQKLRLKLTKDAASVSVAESLQ